MQASALVLSDASLEVSGSSIPLPTQFGSAQKTALWIIGNNLEFWLLVVQKNKPEGRIYLFFLGGGQGVSETQG